MEIRLNYSSLNIERDRSYFGFLIFFPLGCICPRYFSTYVLIIIRSHIIHQWFQFCKIIFLRLNALFHNFVSLICFFIIELRRLKPSGIIKTNTKESRGTNVWEKKEVLTYSNERYVSVKELMEKAVMLQRLSSEIKGMQFSNAISYLLKEL